ncbi:SRPBCC domain-containing protein [Caulobacter sp. SLTY]|uniref:SRPBCC family protein n=1 Tax=Caulobacter sp. SLTY TaxID=2683262 RepID=UPI001411FFBC|nr:SRPBCC domain-containing protein [Caulobacter sp. SLTY]NBB15533.1 SRPBCC domain-containing protein [Caulobacter sp. SLTY]
MRDIDLCFELEDSADKVWRALTTPALLARWLGPNDFVARVGARFTVGGAANDNVDCEVLALEAGRLLRLGWREGEFDSVVTFALEPGLEGGVRLRLTHDGFVTHGGLPAPLVMDPIGTGGWRMSWAA